MGYIETNKKLLSNARTLRKSATPEENHLWYDYLKSYPIQFNRQKVIGNYIVDFYCKAAGLVIELDGAQHYEEEALFYDAARTEYLKTQNLFVLRFTNAEINKKFFGVCKTIDQAVKEAVSSVK